MNVERQYCTFTIGDGRYGVDVMKVQEIVRQQAMTRVPLAPPEVRGLINLRGQIVTAIDLRRRLGIADLALGEAAVNVVVTTEEGAVSLLVDEIGDVAAVPESAYEPPPETMQGPARGLITGAYKLEDQLLLVLDADRAVDLVGAPTKPPNE